MAEKQVEVETKSFEAWAKEKRLSAFLTAFVRGYHSFAVGKLLSENDYETAVKAALSARFS